MKNGTNEPDIEGYIVMSKLFNCSVEYIAGKSETRNPNKEKNDFRFAYHSETEGLTDEEIADALRFYKEMKKKVKGDK